MEYAFTSFMRFCVTEICYSSVCCIFIVVEQLSVYFGFCNENSWFKISKDDKNYLQSCEVCLMVVNKILC